MCLQVTQALSKSDGAPSAGRDRRSVPCSESPDGDEPAAEAQAAVMAESLARTNRQLRSLLESVLAGSSRGRGGGLGDAEGELGTDSKLEDPGGLGPTGLKGAADETLAGSTAWQWQQWHQPRDVDLFEDDSAGGVSGHASSPASQPCSGLSKALRSLVDAIQDRETRVVALEAEVARSREAMGKDVGEREAALEASAAEGASLRAEVRAILGCFVVRDFFPSPPPPVG